MKSPAKKRPRGRPYMGRTASMPHITPLAYDQLKRLAKKYDDTIAATTEVIIYEKYRRVFFT